MNEIFPYSDNSHDFRNCHDFESTNVHSVYNGTETISFRGPKPLNMVPNDIRTSASLKTFKEKIKRWKPEGCTCRMCKIYIPNLGFIS